jgi:hypothetical protein
VLRIVFASRRQNVTVNWTEVWCYSTEVPVYGSKYCHHQKGYKCGTKSKYILHIAEPVPSTTDPASLFLIIFSVTLIFLSVFILSALKDIFLPKFCVSQLCPVCQSPTVVENYDDDDDDDDDDVLGFDAS